MKKNILFFSAVLTSFSLMAFAYINWSDTDTEGTSGCKTVVSNNHLENTTYKKTDLDLVYKVESRFMTTITKEDLSKARSVIDIYPEKATQSIVSYQEVKVFVHNNDSETSEPGVGELLNAAQLKLLESTDYSTDIHLTANCKRMNAYTGELEDHHIVYYMTITPEKEAEFTSGHDTLIEYLKENTREKTAIIKKDKLQPGKVSFTVTKSGKVENVNLTSTSGYPSVDEKLVKTITTMPEKWDPATNSKGERVDQGFVFFFGLQGC